MIEREGSSGEKRVRQQWSERVMQELMSKGRHFCGRTGLCVFAALTTMALSAGQVLAQNTPANAEIKLPAPGVAPEPKFWLSYFVSFALLVAVVMVSLRPAKRSHQD